MWMVFFLLRQTFRHGDRSPGLLYTNDPYKNYSWPGGPGALTRKGSFQLYDLGKHLRSRYQRLLPSDGYYSKENMLVLSSNPERCVMSAQSMLAGLMPPDDCEYCLPSLWQPVAVNTMPAEEDYVRKKAIYYFLFWMRGSASIHFHQNIPSNIFWSLSTIALIAHFRGCNLIKTLIIYIEWYIDAPKDDLNENTIVR